MKKILSALMLVACLFMAMPSQAQVHFGIKGGVDISKMSFSKGDYSSDNRTGFFVGPMVEFTLPIVGLGIDAAALYSQTRLNLGGEGSDNFKSIEIPVNLKWSFGLGSMLGAYLAAGPQFGFAIDEGFWDDFGSEKSSISVNVGAGVKLLKHLQIGINYNIGCSKFANFMFENEDGTEYETNIRKNSWQVSLAYMF